MSTIRLSRPAVLASGREKAFEVARPLTAKVLQGAKHLAPQGSHLRGSGRRVPGPTLKASLHSRQVLRDIKQVTFEIGSPFSSVAAASGSSVPAGSLGSSADTY